MIISCGKGKQTFLAVRQGQLLGGHDSRRDDEKHQQNFGDHTLVVEMVGLMARTHRVTLIACILEAFEIRLIDTKIICQSLCGLSFYREIYWYMPNARHANISRIPLCSIHLIGIIVFLLLLTTTPLLVRLPRAFFCDIRQLLLCICFRLLFVCLVPSCLFFLHAHPQG
jgi:hypothetical protein